jgi:hypothetical protein
MSDTFCPDFADMSQAAPTWNAKRPLRIAVLGDFGAGAGRGRLHTGAQLARRKPLPVEFDTLEDAMQRLGLALTLPLGADGVPVAIELGDLGAFHPDAIFEGVPLFADLGSLRKRLNQPGSFAAAAAEVMAWAENAGPRASSLARRAVARGSAPARGATLDDFARLTGRRSAAARADSAEEFAADLSGASDLCESGLYRLLVDAPSQDADGGYTYVAGCYRFDATPPHAELLGRAARIASHAGASLLLGINTDPFADRREPPHRLVLDAFAALRALPEASFLGLFGPRFLLRHPYGKKSDPISAFAFEEFSRGEGLGGMLWGHPALLALTVLARSGATPVIDDLPFHHYVDEDGDVVALPCTDRLISANVASLLREAGINALMAHKGEALVRFNGFEAVNGDGLAVAGAAPKKARADARFALQSRIDTEGAPAAAAYAPTPRRGSAVPAPTDEVSDEPAQEAQEDEVAEAQAEAPPDDSGEGIDGSTTEEPAAQAKAPDDELAKLLSSLEEAPSAAAAEEPGAEAPMDPELAALLKSLG